MKASGRNVEYLETIEALTTERDALKAKLGKASTIISDLSAGCLYECDYGNVYGKLEVHPACVPHKFLKELEAE